MRAPRLIGGFLALVLAAGVAAAGGAVRGSTGGNEIDCSLFARRKGQIRFAFTGPDGRFDWSDLDPGLYMLKSRGRVVPNFRVRDGRTTIIDWADQPRFDPPCDTWSPWRREFGQTFIAEGGNIVWISFWVPAGNHRLEVTFRKGGPDGAPVGKSRSFGEPVSWITAMGFDAGEFPVERGEVYYLSLRNTDGKPWPIGMPGLGDVYPDGMAYYDGVPQPDSDLSVTISFDNSGLVTHARGAGNLGWIPEGPGSGNCTVAGQTFVARARNVMTAGMLAGWGKEPLGTRFHFAILEGGPDGSQVGPTSSSDMISDWGADGMWFPDEVPVVPGKTYFLKVGREDRKEFFAYVNHDNYAGGTAYRDGKPVEGFDLEFEIRGEETPWSASYPYNIRTARTGARDVDVEWETGTKTGSWLEVRHGEAVIRNRVPSRGKKIEHHATMTGLAPDTPYAFRVVCTTGLPGAERMLSRWYDVRTARALGEPTATPTPVQPPLPELEGRGVPLVNPGFEDGMKGWKSVCGKGAVTPGHNGFLPRLDAMMWGWAQVWSRKPDEEHPKKTEAAGRDLVYQSVSGLTPGKTYEFSGWILTNDVNSGWERDSRVRLVADPSATGRLASLETVDEEHTTQWYATQGRWRCYRLRFKAESERAAIGFEFDQWWELDADYLYVDCARLAEMSE